MAGRVEVQMFNQAGGRFVDILVNKRQQAEAGQKDKKPFRTLKERNDMQPAGMRIFFAFLLVSFLSAHLHTPWQHGSYR